MNKVNSDVAYEYIRKRILNGEYPPGHQLTTEDLAKEIGVSRTPVREALHQLKADGLVSIRARLGASVKTMSVREFRELCDLRLALEGHAAALAAVNHTPADLREIKFALYAMRELTERIRKSERDQPWITRLVREDVRFHIGIMTAAKNELMKAEILRLHLVNRIVFGSGAVPTGELTPVSKAKLDANRRAVQASHEGIYRAIARGDATAAKRAMEAHIQEIIDKSLDTIALSDREHAGRELTEEELAYNG